MSGMDEFIKKYGGVPGPGLIIQAMKWAGYLVVEDEMPGGRR